MTDLIDILKDLFQRAAEQMHDRTVIIDEPENNKDKHDDEAEPGQVLQHLHRISMVAHGRSDQTIIVSRRIHDQIAGLNEHIVIGPVFSGLLAVLIQFQHISDHRIIIVQHVFQQIIAPAFAQSDVVAQR